ncbi:MAG: hypothetical protein HFI99_07870 [Lachnospiraceae bacterium]|nr:hypothetical protein [Lachnospiraceae bacterium]
MKKIVIVEDKPWITQNAICDLQKKNINVIKMVYYPNAFGDEKEKKKLMDLFKEKTKVEVDEVSSQEEFVNKMDWFYTASSAGNVAVLYHNFPDNVLPVTKYYEGILEWKEEKIDQILG